VRRAYELKISFEQTESLAAVERYTILSAIDRLWQEHLYGMDSLRASIGLRAYGQRDPLLEYKAEAFKVFEDLMVNIKTEICHNIFRSASSLMAFERFSITCRNAPPTSPPAPSANPRLQALNQAAMSSAKPPPPSINKRTPLPARAQSGTQRSLPVPQRQAAAKYKAESLPR
jgi:preprotein translocase subunit SecA